jgi:hypothetical protein
MLYTYPHHLVMPVLVAILYYFLVSTFYRHNSQKRRRARKDAGLYTTIFGMAPVVFYCIGYAIKYFLL